MPGTAPFAISGNNSPATHYARRSARAPINICLNFSRLEEIERFGKELDQYRSQLFRKEYLPRVRPFPKVRELFQRIRDDDKRIILASSGKEEDTKYYIEDLLKIDDLIEGYTCADDADRSKPAPDIFTAALDKLGEVLPRRHHSGGHALRHRSRGQSRGGDNRPPLRRDRRKCFTRNRRHRHLPRPGRYSRPLRQAFCLTSPSLSSFSLSTF